MSAAPWLLLKRTSRDSTEILCQELLFVGAGGKQQKPRAGCLRPGRRAHASSTPAGSRARRPRAAVSCAVPTLPTISTIDVPQMFSTRRIQARVLARIRKEIGVEVKRAVEQILRTR